MPDITFFPLSPTMLATVQLQGKAFFTVTWEEGALGHQHV